jgi:hypothetical protein
MDINSIKKVLEKLPHSQGRVPYTYHHDYLRTYSEAHKDMSRSDIAGSHDSNELELYACALDMVFMSLCGESPLSYLDIEDIQVLKDASVIADKVVKRHNSVC